MGHAMSCYRISDDASVGEIPMPANGHQSRKWKKKHPTPRAARIKECALILGVGFTKSKTWTGQPPFDGQCLHDISDETNPYICAVSWGAKALDVSDPDHLIRCYGFGDVTAAEDAVFSFFDGNEPAKGLEAFLERYQEIAPHVKLHGPTSFAPLIRQAMRDVHNSGMKYHVLLILANGEISKECLEDTNRAILDASAFPMSIVMVGVGDGPWTEMSLFDAVLPERRWNNFHFLELNKITHRPDASVQQDREESFQSRLLKTLAPDYKYIRKLSKNAKKADVPRLTSNSPLSVQLVIPPPDIN